MESLQALKTRLRAVKNIGQITKAMEVVAATKMRRAQEAALVSRPYAIRSLELLGRIMASAPAVIPLMQSRPIRTTALLLVSSDRGLAGPFNAQVFRAAEEFLTRDQYRADTGHRYLVIAVGKKAIGYGAKRRWELAGSFQGFGDAARPEETAPVAELLVSGFLAGQWDRVMAVSTHFRTTLRQEVLIRQILPTDAARISETVAEILPERGRFAGSAPAGGEPAPVPERPPEYLFEPSPAAVLSALVPHLIAMQIYHLVLEANASEHSARRVAMKNASDNADELSDKITISANNARQAGITTEIIEITSTQSALT